MFQQTVPGVTDPVVVRTQGPQVCGNYPAFYAQLREWTLGTQAQLPVTVRDVAQVMQVLEQGAVSARSGCWLPLNG